jgi:hypothetical protein
LFTGDSPLEALEAWLYKHGYWKFCELRNMGDDNMIVTSDLNVIKEVGNSEKLIFRQLTIDPGLEKLGMLNRGVFMNPNEVTWKQHRGLIIRAVNSASFLENASKTMQDMFEKQVIPELNSYAESGTVLIMKNFFKRYFMTLQERLLFTHSTSDERSNVADYVANFFDAWHFYALFPPFIWPLFSKKM